MPEYNVKSPDIPINPAEAKPFLIDYCADNQADFIIGTSMGGREVCMYAMQLTTYPRLCVNPTLYMSNIKDILRVGTFEYFQPTADRRTHYMITEDIVRHFEEMERHLFDGITEENQSTCWGFFADENKIVNCTTVFATHFYNVIDFHDKHRMDIKVLRDTIIPFAQKNP